MLVEPDRDEARLAADRAVAQAVRARLALGGVGSPDAQALAVREALVGAAPTEATVLRAVLGRIEAGSAPALTVWGAISRTLAADRYGLVARPAVEPEQALAAVREGGRAMLDLAPGKAWWGRLLAEPGLRVVAALPDDRRGAPQALMVQAASPGPTGDDRTLWATDSALSDARIIEALSAQGLAASPLVTGAGLKLFMFAGYVQAEDGRLDGAPGRLTGVIGAAPVF